MSSGNRIDFSKDEEIGLPSGYVFRSEQRRSYWCKAANHEQHGRISMREEQILR